MTSPALAIVYSDGSMTVLPPATRQVEALKHCADLNDWEPHERVRLVRVALEIVEDIEVEELIDG